VDYDWGEKVHRLKVHFKLPVFQLVNGVEKEKSGNYLISKRQETPVNQPDQKTPLSFHSTVISSTVTGSNEYNSIEGVSSDSKGNEYNHSKGYSLRMTVDLTCSYLWTSPYSIYQQELFSLICKLHEEDGWDFKQVSDWLNGNGYKSVRGMTFKENHVWSIYMKKRKSIQRFSREYDPEVTDMKVDVVDYIPKSE